jgi:hypothetical protein
MSGDPDAEYGNVDGGDQDDSAPFEPLDRTAMLSDERDSVDDDLHQQLDLEDPEEQNEEQDWYAVTLR